MVLLGADLALPAELPGQGGAQSSEASRTSLSLREAARKRQFWLLLGVYAICGLDDFFVTTHVAAFAQPRFIADLVDRAVVATRHKAAGRRRAAIDVG